MRRHREILAQLRALGAEEVAFFDQNELPPEIQKRRQVLIEEAKHAGLSPSQIERVIQRGYKEVL